MTKTFFASDLHLGHTNACLKFTRADGSPLRNFPSAEEMDNHILEKWNSTVADEDRVYLLGDCVMNRRYLPKLKLLKGRIKLVLGNHDIFPLNEYPSNWEITGYVVKPKAPFIASHIPLKETSLDRFGLNIHGHLHANVENDPRYINVSMEQIQYTPISLDDVLKRVEQNKVAFAETGNVINFSDLKE